MPAVDNAVGQSKVPTLAYRPMIDPHSPLNDERQVDRRRPGNLVGRETEMDRIQAFLATARTDGGALLVTGEPGIGKTELLDAAAEVAAAADTRILHAAGVEFEAGMSFSGLNQVLLPLLDVLPQLPAVHRDALNVALGFGEGVAPEPARRVECGALAAARWQRPIDRCSSSSTTCPGWTERAPAC